MKSNKQNKHNRRLYILLSIFFILIIANFAFIFLQKTQVGNYHYASDSQLSIPTSTNKTYHSKFLKISFNFPNNYQLDPRFNTIILSNERGEILIDKYGTNFQKLNEHIDNLSKLNHFTISKKEELIINNYPSVKGMIDTKKIYFFYPSLWTIVTFSTNSPALYDDLDQIAQSFHYNP